MFKTKGLKVNVNKQPEESSKILSKRRFITFTNPDGQNDTLTVYLDSQNKENQFNLEGDADNPVKRTSITYFKDEFNGHYKSDPILKHPQNTSRAPIFWREPFLAKDNISSTSSTIKEPSVANEVASSINYISKNNETGFTNDIDELLKKGEFETKGENTIQHSLERNIKAGYKYAFGVSSSVDSSTDSSDDGEDYEYSVSNRKKSTASDNKANKNMGTKKSAELIKHRIRGNYNMLDLDERVKILQYASKNGIDAAHSKFNICKSRIRRYINHGADRKKGGGRKTLDPYMETNLLKWIEKSAKNTLCFPSRCIIKEKAKEISIVGDFLASKGWCDKFFKRNYERLEKIKSHISK